MNPWNFFERIFVINLIERTDRMDEFAMEAAHVGMTQYAVICGVRDTDPTKGFNQAQRNALEAAYGPTLILEDDCVFKNWQHLPQALIDLPEDWDLLYLGANIIGSNLCDWPTPTPITANISRVHQAWTTHAVAYSQKGRDKILAEWDHTNGQIYDDYLRCNLETLKAYIVNPMIADQRPGFSDIWRRDTHYGFFKQGNERMRRYD